MAVSLRPGNANVIDSRGVAFAVSGKLTQAAKDFQTFVTSDPLDENSLELRKEWISELRTNHRNPLTPAVRASVLSQEGISINDIKLHLR